MKQIKIGKTLLTVASVYPYCYDYGKGKQVLRIEVAEKDHSFNDLLVFQNCTTDIEYLENNVSKNIYSNYSLDFNCQYNEGRYSIEITRKSEETRRLELVENAFTELLLGGVI